MRRRKMKIKAIYKGSLVALGLLLGLTGCTDFGQDRQVARLRLQAIERQTEGDYAGSAELLQSALGQANERDSALKADLYLYLGRAMEKQEKLDEAAAAYSHSLEQKRSMEGYYSRGYVYLLQEKNDAARGDFREAVLLAKDEPELFAGVYQLFAERNQAARGADVLKALQQQLGDNQPIEKGLVYMALENYKSAVMWFEKAISDGRMSGYYYLGEVEKKKGNYEAAIKQYELYEEKKAPDVNSLNSKGYCLAMQEKWQEALEQYQKAVELPISDGTRDSHWNVVVLQERLGEYEKARQAMGKLLELYPNDEAALREKRFLDTK